MIDLDQTTAVLNSSLLAGRILLENGANTALVEETIARLGVGLGADSLEVSVSPHAIMATLIAGPKQETRVLRITKSAVDLAKLGPVLALVARAGVEPMTAREAEEQLQSIQGAPRHYGPWVVAVAVGLACAGFAANFGATPRDAAVVLLSSTLAQCLRHLLSHTRMGRLLSSAIVAAFASTAAFGLTQGSPNSTVAAAVLLLVPGIPLMSGTLDLFRGDVLPGMARVGSALVTILFASAGMWAVVLVFGPGDRQGFPGQESLLVAAVMGAVAAAGFAVLFDVPPRILPWSGLVGGLAVLIRNLTLHQGGTPEVANLLAGLAIGLSAEFLARRIGSAYSLLAIPGYIPLVPGSIFFLGILHLVSGDVTGGFSSLVRAQIILIAVALGMGTIPALFDTRRKAML